MQKLRVKFLKHVGQAINQLSLSLDELEKHALSFTPWNNYPYKPNVQFCIAFSNDCILLKYFVEESTIRAVEQNINGKVWEDSCVEFFVSFDEKGYYNFEFNCVGTAFVGFGKSGKKRRLLSEKLIHTTQRQTTINKKDDGVHWELTVLIPFAAFTAHNIRSLSGKHCRANFYKCGDLLPQPHYLTWADIESPEPNFHLPQFFGELVFVQDE